MKLSKDGERFIKHFEKLRLTAYPDGDHHSIGWGHNGPDVEPGMKITRTRADQLFRKDIEWAEAAVLENVKVPLNQSEFDSLVSFVYTIGEPRFQESTLLQRLNRNERIPAADHMRRWNRFEGKIAGGLVKRRAAEKAIFLGQSVESAITAGEDAYAAYNKRL